MEVHWNDWTNLRMRKNNTSKFRNEVFVNSANIINLLNFNKTIEH